MLESAPLVFDIDPRLARAPGSFGCIFATSHIGITRSSVAVTPSTHPRYTACGVWQDFRSIGSFLLGAFVCCVLSHGKEVSMAHAAMVDSAEKVLADAWGSSSGLSTGDRHSTAHGAGTPSV